MIEACTVVETGGSRAGCYDGGLGRGVGGCPLLRARAEGEQHQLGTSPYARAGEMRAMMPRRPAWSYDMSSGRLHFREAKAFQHWLGDVRARIQERGG